MMTVDALLNKTSGPSSSSEVYPSQTLQPLSDDELEESDSPHKSSSTGYSSSPPPANPVSQSTSNRFGSAAGGFHSSAPSTSAFGFSAAK